VETPEQLESFYMRNRAVDWMAFDTEFIPERYYHNKLCLISVASPLGNFIIDVIKVPDISLFIRFVESPGILKITHAGENDYRILVKGYGASPHTLFDTQLAYGFLDYEYPLGLQLLAQRDLNQQISKRELRSDWEKRPLTQDQLAYAARDVAYLEPLMNVIRRKLKMSGKLGWAEEEHERWENPDYFKADPVSYYCKLPMRNLSKRQKIFMVRLHQWRSQKAQSANCPLNEVLKSRYITTIVKNFTFGKKALLQDRTLPDTMLHRNWSVFQRLYHESISIREETLLDQLPDEGSESVQLQLVMDQLHLLIKMKASARSVSPSLVAPKKEINKMKEDRNYFPPWLGEGWRKELLGEDLMEWLKKRNAIDTSIEDNTCKLVMRD
jgi:ribonuclease D